MAEKFSDKKVIIMCGLICATLIICGVLFWPTIYRYDKTQSKLVRINRITGYTEILSDGLWKPVKKEPKTYYYEPFLAIPKDDIDKIEIKGDFDGKGNYDYNIYNGSKWTIYIIRLSIEAKDNQDKVIWHKIYQTSVNIMPFSTESCSIKLSNYDYAPQTFRGGRWILEPEELYPPGRPEGFNPEVKIEEVFGLQG